MSVCRSCGAEIIWADTANGKQMPMNAKPETGLFLLAEQAQEVPLAVKLSTPVHTSHFATCPQADEWRKR